MVISRSSSIEMGPGDRTTIGIRAIHAVEFRDVRSEMFELGSSTTPYLHISKLTTRSSGPFPSSSGNYQQQPFC